ncbi:MAG: VOC family protein [Gemmatimonadota bacterium]|nr:VOC family protein [Gemmatimonadota bacterium]MDH4352121.1 VOC family protein [Gemmatimonadota bacterium]
MSKPLPGTIGWIDLTVDDAGSIRDFYAAVAGWTHEGVDMGGYADFTMMPPGGDPVAGICHARGGNAGLPAQWMIYIVVENLDAALEAATARGGAIVRATRDMGSTGRYAVIRDPAGAVAALFEAGG